MNASAIIDRENSDFEKFLLNIDDFVSEKEIECKRKKQAHLKSIRKMQILYWILGIQVTVYSTGTTFLTGIYSYQSFTWITGTILILSLGSSILNAVMQFSNVVQKMGRHRDSYNKYDFILMSINRFKVNESEISKREMYHFIHMLDTSLSTANEYEEINCCFNTD